MPFPIACSCGQRFMAQDHLTGKQVPCPACGNELLIAPPAAPKPPVNIPPIPVRCGCGKAYKAPAAMRGKSLKCPACGQDVAIPLKSPPAIPPAVAAAAAPNPFGSSAAPLGGDLFGPDPFAGAPLGNDPLGADLFAGPLAGAPLGGPLATPLPGMSPTGAPQPAHAAYGAPQAADDGGGNTKLLVFLGIGVGVTLLGLAVGVWLVNRNRQPVAAVATNTPPPAAPATTPPAATTPPTTTTPPATSGGNQTASGPIGASPAAPGAPTSSPGSNPMASSPMGSGSSSPMGPIPVSPMGANPSGTGNSGSATKGSGSQDADPAASRPAGKALGAGLMQWHPGGGKLVGTRIVGEGDNLQAHYGWMTQILPFIGRDEEYKKFDFSKPRYDKVNLQNGALIIPEFLNPGDDRIRWNGYPHENYALTHFVGMSGIEDSRNVVAAKLPRSDPRAGVFGYDAIATPAEITDGTSNTIMVLGGGELANPWVMGGGATIRGARLPYFDKITGFGSKGTSGVLVVMADGSVREISSKVDPAVFRALCTIHGADTVDLEKSAPLHTVK